MHAGVMSPVAWLVVLLLALGMHPSSADCVTRGFESLPGGGFMVKENCQMTTDMAADGAQEGDMQLDNNVVKDVPEVEMQPKGLVKNTTTEGSMSTAEGESSAVSGDHAATLGADEEGAKQGEEGHTPSMVDFVLTFFLVAAFISAGLLSLTFMFPKLAKIPYTVFLFIAGGLLSIIAEYISPHPVFTQAIVQTQKVCSVTSLSQPLLLALICMPYPVLE
jgi:hypothetical protein